MQSYDVVVMGGGAAGTAAAIAAAADGARTLLLEAGGFVGGDAVTGLPLLGCCNSRGEPVVAGVLAELLDDCKRMGAFAARVCDWRAVWGVCVHPDALRLAIARRLAAEGVDARLHAVVSRVRRRGRRIETCSFRGRGRAEEAAARFFIDATGDAHAAAMAGLACEAGDERGAFQPVSLVFRMMGVDAPRLLAFVRDHPEEALLAENPVFPASRRECARRLFEAGHPYVALAAEGELLGAAIQRGDMFPCTALFMTPWTAAGDGVTINATRVAGVDARDDAALSAAALQLSEQVAAAVRFLRGRVPGFERAEIACIAPRVGVRESRRIVGQCTLTERDVLEGRKRDDGVAKGAHHIDLHAAGTRQTRIPVKDGASYDIPFGCLLPRETENLLVAGRCLSSTRAANGSARVMGACFATGHAAGAAAALCAREGLRAVGELSIPLLRARLRAEGAILDGTH